MSTLVRDESQQPQPAPSAAPAAAAPAPPGGAKQAAKPARPADMTRAIQDVSAKARSKPDYYRQVIKLLAAEFDALLAVLNLEGPTGNAEEVVRHGTDADNQWMKIARGLLLDTRYRNEPRGRFYHAPGVQGYLVAMGVPLSEPGEGTIGSLVVICKSPTTDAASGLLAQLRAWVTLAAGMSPGLAARGNAGGGAAPAAGAAPTGQPAPDFRGVGKAAGYESVEQFAFAVVNSLKSKLGCEQISLGRVEGRGVRVICVSGMAELYARSPGLREIQQAMCECLDAGTIVAYQSSGPHSGEPGGLKLLIHKHWHEATGRASVASVPLVYRNEVVAVLSVRGAAQQTFSDGDLKKIQEMVAPLSQGLMLVERAGRGLRQHVRDELRRFRRAVLAKGAWGRKALGAAAALLAAWMVFGKMEYVVSAPCELICAEERILAAPFEGTLAAVHVRPGDEVQADQILVEFDTRDIQLEQNRLGGEIEIARTQLTRAMAERNTGVAGEAQAQLDMARAQVELIRYRLDRALVRAPADGTVVEGDLLPRIGEVVPLGEPLLQLAPRASMTVEIHVPEHAVAMLATGLAGQFTTHARPELSQTMRLDQLQPRAEIKNGQNVFVARAELVDKPEWLRAGMTGVARVRAGSQPAWWVLLHRAIDNVRLKMWQL